MEIQKTKKNKQTNKQTNKNNKYKKGSKNYTNPEYSNIIQTTNILYILLTF